VQCPLSSVQIISCSQDFHTLPLQSSALLPVTSSWVFTAKAVQKEPERPWRKCRAYLVDRALSVGRWSVAAADISYDTTYWYWIILCCCLLCAAFGVIKNNNYCSSQLLVALYWCGYRVICVTDYYVYKPCYQTNLFTTLQRQCGYSYNLHMRCR